MQDFSMSVLTFQRKQRTLGDIHFCFLSQLAYNSEILSKFVVIRPICYLLLLCQIEFLYIRYAAGIGGVSVAVQVRSDGLRKAFAHALHHGRVGNIGALLGR